MTTYFQTDFSSDLIRRLNEACRVAGADKFSLAGDLLDLARRLPDVRGTQALIAKEVLASPPADPDAWLRESLDRLTDARAAEDLVIALKGHMGNALKLAAGRLTTEAHGRVKGAAEQAVTDLTEAAQELHGDDPLDMSVAFANDATADWKTATGALTVLGTLASIHGDRPSRGNPPTIKSALTVVALPDPGDPEPVYGLSGAPVGGDPVPARDQAREVLHALADPEQVDTTLVRVARGDWDLVTLSLASPAELRRRDERSVAAFKRVAVQPTSKRAVNASDSIG